MKTLLALALLSTSAFAHDNADTLTVIDSLHDRTTTYTGKIVAYDDDETINYVDLEHAQGTVTGDNDHIFFDGFEDRQVNWVWDINGDNFQTGYEGHCTGTRHDNDVTLTCTYAKEERHSQ